LLILEQILFRSLIVPLAFVFSDSFNRDYGCQQRQPSLTVSLFQSFPH
jgi:hypothetical protein